MELRELRIGDLVYYNGKNVGRVYSLHGKEPRENNRFDNKEFVTLSDFGFVDVGVEEIFPIPIIEIEDILKKNGFSYDEGRKVYKLTDGTTFSIFIALRGEYKVSMHLRKHDKSSHDERVLMACEYVHNLQHLILECGLGNKIKI